MITKKILNENDVKKIISAYFTAQDMELPSAPYKFLTTLTRNGS